MTVDDDLIDKLDELFVPNADPDNPEAVRFAADLKFEWDMQQLDERRKRVGRREEGPPR